MDIKLIRQELDKLNQIVSGWEDNNASSIEQDITLELLKKIYTEIKFATPATPATPAIKEQEEPQVQTTTDATPVTEPQVEVEFIFDEEEAELESEEEIAEEVVSEQNFTPEEATSEEDTEEVVFEHDDEQIIFEEEEEEVAFEEEVEEEVAFEEKHEEALTDNQEEVLFEEEEEVYSDEEEIIFEDEQPEEVSTPTHPAKSETPTNSTTSIGNLFGEEETPQNPNRTKHQRMMSIYNDHEEEEQSVDISKIFDLDDDEEFIIDDGSDEEEVFIVNQGPSIAEANKQNDQTAILADVIAPAKPTIADSIEAPTAIADEINNAPLKSLRDGIGINDKFLMIRDLFDGDADEYEQVIKQLDSMENFDDCMIYIVENFAWNPESDGAKFIMKLLERKLA